MKRQEKFSIRKLSIGAASVLLGTFLVAGQGQVVSANELVDEVVTLAQATDDSDSQTTVVETIEIASPVTYVADETQEVGYHEVEVEGQAGQLIISETDGVTTAERIEPTASREVYGTKPEVVEEILEKATTEYVANDKLEAGSQVVRQEGVDGKKVTTTSYRVQVQEEVKKDLVGKSTIRSEYDNIERQIVKSDYINQYGYSIDDSFSLPSDKIIVDEDALKESLVAIENASDLSDVLKQTISSLYAGEYSSGAASGSGPAAAIAKSIEGYFLRNSSNPDRYADVKADYIRFQEALEQVYSTHQGQDLIEFIRTYLANETGTGDIGQSYRTYGLQKSDDYSSPMIYEFKINRTDGPSLITFARRYLNELEQAGVDYEIVSADQLKIDGEVYRISSRGSTSFEPTKFASEWTDEEVLQKFNDWVEDVHTSFETQTKRYNNNLGFSDSLNIVYDSTLMPEEEKEWFTQQLEKLPTAIKQALVKVTVTDDYLDGRRGVAYGKNYQIKLEYPVMGSKEELLRVFMHELSHIIDYNALSGHSNLSYSSEFSGSDSIYEKHYNRPITEEQVPIRAYNQDSTSEAFAEFFGYYLLSRFYGYDYVKYIEIDGEVLTLRTADWGNTPEEVKENRENARKYYDDPRAYSPVEESKWFYDKLYTLLFEQETTAEVVVDQITTEVIDVQQKIVEVGTKPQVVEQITTYTTIEREDAELLIGEKRVIQVGKDGIVKKTTRYELVDKITGKVVATTTSEVIQELVEEIIAVGTKVAEVVEPEEQTPTEEPSVSEPEVEVPIEETTALPTESPVEEEKPEEVVETPTEEPSTAPEVTEEPSVDEPVSEPEVETPTEEASAIPTESPVEEEKPEEVVETPTEEPSTAPEVTEEPSVDEPVSEPEVETPTEEATAIPSEAPVEEKKTEAVIETPTEEPSTTPEVTEEPSLEEVVTEPVVEEEISAIPDYAPEEEALPEYVFDPADFQDILEPSQEEVSDKESSSQASGAGAASGQDKAKADSLSGIGSADRPVITATATAPSYSRTARAAAEKSLPNTGDSSALLSLVGFGLTTLGLVGRKRRQG